MTVYCVKYTIYEGEDDDGPFSPIHEDGSGTWHDKDCALMSAIDQLRELLF